MLKQDVVASRSIGHQESDDGLAVGPPQLHIRFERNRRTSVDVEKINQSAVVFRRVPAVCERANDEMIDGRLSQFVVVEEIRLTQEKPTRFDGVAWIHESTSGTFELNSFRRNRFEDETFVSLGKYVYQLFELRRRRYLFIACR